MNQNLVDQVLVGLIQDLVRIPSWVGVDEKSGEVHNENELVAFLEGWLQRNTDLEVLKQSLPDGRYNLIARKGRPDLVFLAHTDTVTPSEGAPYDQFAAEIHDGKLWGLGSTDMKSGIAAILDALRLAGEVDNLWLILYADEEYDFLGMKELISQFSDIRPKLIVSSDGSDLRFGFGCRGCIEFRMRVHGEGGHAARKSGQSAIWAAIYGLVDLRRELDLYTHPKMGPVSMNIASIIGGTKLPDGASFSSDGLLKAVGQQGNRVSDIVEFLIDIRPPTDALNLEVVLEMLQRNLDRQGVRYEVVRKTHDLAFWYTDPDRLQCYINIAKDILGQDVSFDDPGNTGYLDLQMLWDATGRPDALMFGAGYGDTAHGPNEHISISNLVKSRDFFLSLLIDHKAQNE